MTKAKYSYVCTAFSAVLLQLVTGSVTQEQSTVPAVTGMVDSGNNQSPTTTTSKSTTIDLCEVLSWHEDCYKRECRVDDQSCIVFLLLDSPVKIRAILSDDYHLKPVAFYSVVEAIHEGLQLSVKECQHQFFWDLWNCPVTPDAVVTGQIHSTGTRQVAFVQAISAAAVMHTVTKTCSHRENVLCRCGRINNKTKNRYYDPDGDNFWWGGCSDNVNFGGRVSEQFFKTDTKDKSKMTRLVKSHNERVGRMAVKDSIRLNCRCHGQTGSCTIKTCWTVMANFREIGNILREKYEFSIKRVSDVEELLHDKRKNVTHVKNSTDETNKYNNKPKEIRKQDLVYFAESPMFCTVNHTAGYPGTVGRECLKEPTEKSAYTCNILCEVCGNEVEELEYDEIYECDCTELWCCSKRCKHCKRRKTKYFCK